MFEKKIKLADREEVCGFVKAAEKCDFDIDIYYNRYVVDAKSFLGRFRTWIFKRAYREIW